MKYMAKYSRISNGFVDAIQKQPQPTLHNWEELCSNTCLNNCSLSEKTYSPIHIHQKGFYQTEAQKALQNAEINRAFEVAEQYIQVSKRKFFRFLDTETKKITLFKQLSRFDSAYVSTAKEKLKGLQNMGCGYDIQHITLTISHTKNADYIRKYQQLKSKLHNFIIFFRRVIKKKIDYISTYEVTQANDGQFHQHIHLIVIGVGFLTKKIIALLSAKWKKIADSRYIHFKYFSKNRNIDIFSYVMKYVTKEFANINLTTVLLFSVKGKAYTMSLSLSRLISEKIINIDKKKYKYIDSFEAQDIFYGYNISDYDPASLTFFFSFLAEDEKMKLLSEGVQQAEARQKTQKETEERDERDIGANKKNNIAITNMIKIK